VAVVETLGTLGTDSLFRYLLLRQAHDQGPDAPHLQDTLLQAALTVRGKRRRIMRMIVVVMMMTMMIMMVMIMIMIMIKDYTLMARGHEAAGRRCR
jgi:hypothetical protein